MEGISIVRLSTFIVFAVICLRTCSAYTKPEVNCSAGHGKDKRATLACHTCMGRDSVSCDWGTVCCRGSCFTLIDEEHDIIAKGCTNEVRDDGSKSTEQTNVMLPWANDEPLHGVMHYCSKTNYCNGESRLIGSTTVLLVTWGVLKAVI